MNLLTSLAYHYAFDEASGAAVDSLGANNLTDNNTVGTGAGILGTARDFVSASGEFFSHSSNATFQTGDINWQGGCWVYLKDKSATYAIAGEHNGSSIAGSAWWAHYDNASDRFKMEVYSGASNSTSVLANTFGSPSATTWYHLQWKHDAANDIVGLRVNNGAWDTVSWTHGINTTSEDFRVGRIGGSLFPLNGRIDELALWKRLLTDNENTRRFNKLTFSAFGSYQSQMMGSAL